MAENAGDLITSIDPRGDPHLRLAVLSRAARLRARRADRQPRSRHRPPRRPRAHRPLPAVRAGGRARERRRRASGTRTATGSGWRHAGAPCATSRARSVELQTAARDVTERRRADETLRASEAAAVAARDSLSDGARRDDAVRDHRHRRRRPDHGLQRRRRAHARLPRRRRRRAPSPRAVPRPR